MEAKLTFRLGESIENTKDFESTVTASVLDI